MAANIVPIYLSEIAPSPMRGRLVVTSQLMTVGGGFSSYLICYLLKDEWRFMFGVGVVPAALQVAGMLFMPESPRWLLKYNKQEQA